MRTSSRCIAAALPSYEMTQFRTSTRRRLLLSAVLWSIACRQGRSYVPSATRRSWGFHVHQQNDSQTNEWCAPRAVRKAGLSVNEFGLISTALSGRSQGFEDAAVTPSSYISPLQEAVSSLLGTMPSSREFQPSALIDAAASLTQDACQLLGTKSIGVDYGLARTGIAVTVGFEPKPLEIIQSNLTSVVCEHVVRHAEREKADTVVVGLPLHKNGSVAEQTEITLEFCQELAAKVLSNLGPSVPVVVWDERYTSKEAAARAHSRDPDRFLYGTLDAEAACIILEHYYVDNGVGAFKIVVNDDVVRRQCLDTYETRRQLEEQRKADLMEERNRKLQRRKELIARARELELQRSADGTTLPDKRKKRKRRR